MFSETLLDKAASEDLLHYKPQHIIEAVNALLPLGKNQVLDTIESYANNQQPEKNKTGLFLLLRVLFEVPANPGYQLPMRLGGSSPAPPPDPKSLPHFPIVIIDDRPLIIIQGYTLGGIAESISVHINHFRAGGVLRKNPLVPKQTSESVVSQFLEIYKAAYGKPPSDQEINFIRTQLNN